MFRSIIAFVKRDTHIARRREFGAHAPAPVCEMQYPPEGLSPAVYIALLTGYRRAWYKFSFNDPLQSRRTMAVYYNP